MLKMIRFQIIEIQPVKEAPGMSSVSRVTLNSTEQANHNPGQISMILYLNILEIEESLVNSVIMPILMIAVV